ncbi:MAG TPA: lysylphosphatidylglycerol synthase transmembrane domain-containing protein [Solirubrobacteraceae bacterium]|nr:lysylphosphatidylglycerol synthase transmembrane domain-containing protein [Solirubrobacteraceae bacterium]
MTVALLAALVVFALQKIDVGRIDRALARVNAGWIAFACVLMAVAFLARAESWFAVIRSALPGDRIGRPPVIRALFIGMAGSTVAPGRLGEAARVLVVARHATTETGRALATITGTVLAQTALNLIALVVLAAVALGAGAIPGTRTGGLIAVLAVPLLIVLALAASQAILRTGERAERLPRPLAWIVRQVVAARNGLRVFGEPRGAVHAAAMQLAAWAMQWACCYGVLLALGLPHRAGVAAAAVLLAVNVTSIVPITPSNVGVFQAACIAALAAFGVSSARGLAYGLLLQAIEVTVALALGIPSLLREGISVAQLRELTAGGRESDR